jgi:tellurite resistance protein TerC
MFASLTNAGSTLAGAPLSAWIVFHAVMVVLLLVDLLLVGRRGNSQIAAWLWTGLLAILAGCFAIYIAKTQGHQPALEFVSGYLVEGSLSVDNLFIFLLLFKSLRLSNHDQHRVLLWGVLGAIVMRALFIAVGVSLLARFEWIEYIFGAILLIAAIRLLRHAPGQSEPSAPLRWLQQKCMLEIQGPKGRHLKLSMSAFLLVIAAVELTDLIFAMDSIPAVLAISRRAFIVYTSNIFAILGLRSLFFALSGMLEKFHLLHYGLGSILAFVAVKMLAQHWIEIPVGLSLGIILGILAVFIAASILEKPKPA